MAPKLFYIFEHLDRVHAGVDIGINLCDLMVFADQKTPAGVKS